MEENKVLPDYGGGSIAEIPGTIKEFFGLSSDDKLECLEYGKFEDIKNVCVVLIDGLGINVLEENLDIVEDYFPELTERKITSVFPSTTSSALTSIWTGKTPLDHGLIEWEIFEESIGKIINPIPLKDLEGNDIEIEKYYEGKNFVEGLNEKGINCLKFQRSDLINAPFSQAFSFGDNDFGYRFVSDMVVNLRKKLNDSGGRNFFYCHISNIDRLSHRYGPFSEEVSVELECILKKLKKDFLDKLSDERKEDTLFVIASDHGQKNVTGSEYIDLEEYGEIWELLKEKSENSVIKPTGGPRDVYLFTEEPGKMTDKIHEYIDDNVDVFSIDEAVEKGFYGTGEKSELFESRSGDILLLPKNDLMVYHGKEKSELNSIHGGLSSDEMEVPFLAEIVKNLV